MEEKTTPRVRIAPGKKRYALTLTVANVDRFRKLLNEMSLPASVMSSALDDALVSLTDTMERLRACHEDTGRITMGDMFRAIGEQLNEGVPEHEEWKPKPKKSAPAKKSRSKRNTATR